MARYLPVYSKGAGDMRHEGRGNEMSGSGMRVLMVALLALASAAGVAAETTHHGKVGHYLVIENQGAFMALTRATQSNGGAFSFGCAKRRDVCGHLLHFPDAVQVPDGVELTDLAQEDAVDQAIVSIQHIKVAPVEEEVEEVEGEEAEGEAAEAAAEGGDAPADDAGGDAGGDKEEG